MRRKPRLRHRIAAVVAGGVAGLLAALAAGVAPETVVPVDLASTVAGTAQLAVPAKDGWRNATGETASAMTQSGRGGFADLEVTVGQTKDLVNQSIAVSWAWQGDDPGRHATVDGAVNIRANYLQIFQCWGEGAPDRTQCEYGGLRSSAATGTTYSASRRLFPLGGTGPANPNDPIDAADAGILTADDKRDYLFQGDQGDSGRYAVPFRTVDGETYRHDGLATNPFYGEFDTNEIPFAVTRGDGTGFETFETLTFRESSALGCGDILTSGAKKGQPRSCWLVVVPRGDTEVDGRALVDVPDRRLQSSPLSASNWANRIVFPLGFAPIGQPCPIGAEQRLTGGVETSSEVVLRWQPALCRNGGSVYGYSKLPDAVAEGTLTGGGSDVRGLSFLNQPVAPDQIPADRTAVYAPIALSGVTFSALIERTPLPGATDLEPRRGERVADINLTPRLVAKLLTQFYRAGVDTGPVPGYIAANPANIGEDPEFLALNPEFAKLTQTGIEVLMPTGVSVTTELIWRWIEADQDARDFLAGLPDPWGKRVNPFYQGLSLPQDTLPKIDPYCRRDQVGTGDLKKPPLCVFDLHPAVQDMREAARQTARGDTQALQWIFYQGTPLPTDPLYSRVPRQAPGTRQLIGITETAAAARYQVTPVKLRNAAGKFVAPTTASMLAGAASMRPSAVPGVVLPNMESTNAAAYPLTTLTYAAAVPNQLTADAARDYATFVRYAAGPGQTPGTAAGTLPEGYAPLPAAMRAQALAAATQIQNRVGPRPAAPEQPAAPAPSGPSTGGGSSGSGSSGGTTPPVAAPVVPPPASAAPPVAAPATKPVATRTPADALVAALARYALVVALVLGLAGAVIAPLVPRIAERIKQRSG